MSFLHATPIESGVRLDDALLVVLCLGGVWSDLRTRRIPNAWNGGFMLAGILAAGAAGGLSGVTSSLGGVALGFAFLYPFFAAGGMGGGDVKFCMAIGALMGWRFLITAALFTGLAMAAQAAIQTWWVAQAHGGLMPFLLRKKQEIEEKVPMNEQVTAVFVPYAVGISAGAALARYTSWNPLGF